MTKPLTTTAFMMLVEEGRVALDEPVHKYIPSWKNLGVFVAGTHPSFLTRPPTRPMLIVDLLRHTSGLTYGFQQRSNVHHAHRETKIGEVIKAGTLQTMIDDLAKIPLEFSPGEAWNYSVATDVVGYLVGKISGKPFEQFLKERILDPLGMNDTDFFVPKEKAHRFAACYSAGVQIGMTRRAAEGKAPSLRGVLFRRRADRHDCRRGQINAAGRPGDELVPLAALVHLRRRRAVLDRGRLLDFLPGAAQWRRTRRRPPARPEDAEADGVEPFARRRRPAGDVAFAVLRSCL